MTISPTPNMALQKPEPSITTGPAWAALLNAITDALDAHDHKPGKGLTITPAAMSIDADLPFANHNSKALRTVAFTDQGSSLSSADVGCLYFAGGNLYCNNGAGAAIQVTSGAALFSSISGAFAVSTPGAYPYTVSSGDQQRVLLVDTSAGRTINLPVATTAVLFCIKDTAASAGTNNISLVPNGTDKIEGVNATYKLTDDSGWFFVISDGVSQWFVGKCIDTPIPAGSLQMYAGASAPNGWLLCDGSAVSRTTYARLFSKVATAFGVGDGSTTFNLPDFRQRFPLGKGASGTGHTIGESGGAIDHTHGVKPHWHAASAGSDFAISASGSHAHDMSHTHSLSTDGDHYHFTISSTGLATAAASNSLGIQPSVDWVSPNDRFSYTLSSTVAGAPDEARTSTTGAHTHSLGALAGSTGAATHTHTTNNFAGRIGLVTGGVDGDVLEQTQTQNPPYLTVNYIIKT